MNEHALIYEYAVVRYVPHVEREEFINVGLLMMCKRRRWIRSAIVPDNSRITAFDPEADTELIRRQLAMFDPAAPTLPGASAEERFRWLSAVKSSSIQTSRPHPGIIDCDENADHNALLNSTFDRLMRDLVL